MLVTTSSALLTLIGMWGKEMKGQQEPIGKRGSNRRVHRSAVMGEGGAGSEEMGRAGVKHCTRGILRTEYHLANT